ncbi:zinc finger domain-containing protein [Solwaraspora sp. WMMD1047]|uniref:Fpg/Nei family DNA glycosylase n=1 Tax=Solwaraspora sp. WMMD1047 TaxID=3016102 RepID=UPI002417F615|nr:DNA-formamidopyrimidine glycosylase family protein [Solwaraspora sp. WMMD1047]MDG4828696.1 zinc finger domain-containing protein [Solwaraspora sp. WMMD1047]
MPEGHTIHRLAARHAELFAGDKVLADSPQGRFAAGAALLSGAVLAGTEAYGKHLLHHYSGGHILHVHLGLYGKFTDGAGDPPPPVGQLRLRLTSDRHWLELRGPTACELLSEPEVAALRARLGPDPLRTDADPARAYARISRSPTALAALLLDQSVVAGTGLIFVTEALFRAGLPPTAPGRSLTPAGWEALWADLRELMRAALVTGRIDTVHDRHLPAAMGRPPRVDRHGGEVYVYRRAGQPCHVCAGPVRTATLAGRNSYWCPHCQPAATQSSYTTT